MEKDCDILALLALRLAAASHSDDLAQALRQTPQPWRVLQAGPWQPQSSHWRLAERQLYALRALNLHVVAAPALPPWVLRVRPLPPALFVRGRQQLLWRRGVALVGSRRAAPEARDWTERQARALAERRQLVVSGGALGIDAAAHRGALLGQGPTLVYLGGCVDRAAPVSNRPLFQAILQLGGALVSEHPPLSTTYAAHFALRNRFIAAQARALWVVEAGARSGTLSTAAWARRLGVPIWLAPAGIAQQTAGLRELEARGWAEAPASGRPCA